MYILHWYYVRTDDTHKRQYKKLSDAASTLDNLANDWEYGYGADLVNSEFGFDAIVDNEVHFHAHIEYVKD